MEKYLLVLFMAVAVLGQRQPLSPQQQQQQAQERAYLEYDYGGDDEVLSADPYDSNGGGRIRERGPRPRPVTRPKSPSSNINTYYQTDCKAKERTLPHEQYCDVFYQLNGCANSNDQAIQRSCPNGLIYTGNGRHGLIGVCDYPHRAECNGKERYNPPASTEHCDWLYGIFGHETSCTRYWTCWNGTATEQFCIGGLLYNEETHACDWPQNVNGCQKHPLCKDDANGNVPLGKSCNRYWACQGGYPRLQRCPAMLVFDKQRKRCIAPPTEDCDVPPTTPSPEDENGGSGSGNESGGGGNVRSGNRPRGGGINGGGGDPGGENRRRFETDPRGNLPPPGSLPFNLPEGAQILQRPQQLN